MSNFILGLITGVFVQWFILYIRRARLKIKVETDTEATFGWDSSDPIIKVSLTNVGLTKTGIMKVLIGFKSGSSYHQKELASYQKVIPLDAKSTVPIPIRDISKLIEGKYFQQNDLFRIKVVTIDDKIFCSKWCVTKKSLSNWYLR